MPRDELMIRMRSLRCSGPRAIAISNVPKHDGPSWSDESYGDPRAGRSATMMDPTIEIQPAGSRIARPAASATENLEGSCKEFGGGGAFARQA